MASADKKNFLYKQVYDSLKEDIINQVYTFGALLPSEREIGETYRVDRTTVRKALQLLVDEKLVEKRPGKGTVVIGGAVPERENGTTAAMAVTGAAAPKRYIAFFLPRSQQHSDRITQPFYSELFYALQKECERQGFSLIYSMLEEEDDFEESMKAADYAGIFFVSNVAEKHLARAAGLEVPAVLINSYSPLLPSVLSDNFTGTYKACTYLIEKGHRDIAVLNGIKEYVTNRERMQGCDAAMKEYGISLKPEYNLGGASWEFEAGIAAMKELIESGHPLPSAVIAFNDRLAIGAMQALQQAGIRVPEEVSIIGYDNSEQARFSYPKLTTVEINVPVIARSAAMMLFQSISSYRQCPVKMLAPVALVEHDSVAARPDLEAED